MVKVVFIRGFGGGDGGWGGEDVGGGEFIVEVDVDDKEGGDGGGN